LVLLYTLFPDDPNRSPAWVEMDLASRKLSPLSLEKQAGRGIPLLGVGLRACGANPTYALRLPRLPARRIGR